MELDVPGPVLQFLASDSSMHRAQLRTEHPDLMDRLDAPPTREAMFRWLGADDREPSDPGLLANVLGLLRAQADQSEAEQVRPFTLHPDAVVRQRAYEFLLTLYFPDQNPPALAALLQSMLVDHDDAVRAGGARFIERSDAAGPLGGYLRQWLASAGQRGWLGTESHRLVGLLLEGEDTP